MQTLRYLRRTFKDVRNHSKAIARNMYKPENSFYGWLAMRRMRQQNGFLEESAVKLSNIEPNHRVLEVCFGPGVGIECAYKHIKDGLGKVYGIDHSPYVISKAQKKFEREISQGRIEIREATIFYLPFSDSKFDRIFHVHSYHYWDNILLSLKELKRVIKPGGHMVTTLCIDKLKRQRETELIAPDRRYDPLDYMLKLEMVGFKDVRIEYLKHNLLTYQIIFSESI